MASYTCSLLGSSGATASCAAIGGNGTSGTYGSLSMCSAAIKLSYAMSAYYEYNPVDSSCDFGGNASLSTTSESRWILVNLKGTRSQNFRGADILIGPNTAQDANTAAQSCLQAVPSGGVFTPTAMSSLASATSTSSTSGSSSSSANAATTRSAAYARAELSRWMRIALSASGLILGGAWMLW